MRVASAVGFLLLSGWAFAEELPAERVLRGPTLEAPQANVTRPASAPGSSSPEGKGLRAIARAFDAPVFASTGRRRWVAGAVRRGNAVPVKERLKKRCYEDGKRGYWYELEGYGYVCSASSFEIGRTVEPVDQRQPDLGKILPYAYARVAKKGSPRLKRRPRVKELSNLARSPELHEIMAGDYFVAVDATEEIGGRSFVRTVRGHYVEKDALEMVPTPPMRGEHLGEEWSLPLAFVYGDEEAPLWCLDGNARECGRAEKHARFVMRGVLTQDGQRLVRGDDLAVPADRVRIARQIERPKKVGARERWLHIDLSEQTLVAYEGDEPVYATLVSTGRDGFRTPTGLYRTERKFLTKTMRGRDPVDGIYDVEEIPWVMFYLRGYAIHGAYWHNEFGKVRSHGCTNLAPVDARWIYDWSTHPVPAGWHSTNRGTGTWVYFTD